MPGYFPSGINSSLVRLPPPLRLLPPILAALAVCALAAPPAPKKVLVCTVTTGFRHSSIPDAEKALEAIGAQSGAYTVAAWCRQPDIKVPKKPQAPREPKAGADAKAKERYAADLKKFEEAMAAWTPEKEKDAADAAAKFDAAFKESLAPLAPEALRKAGIDCVIFANTTGELPLPDPQGFLEWIAEGGAFCAMHSGSDTFHKFKPYLDMLQGQFAGHGAQVPADLAAGDTAHPANGGIGETWRLKQEEMYLIKNHDRSTLRALWFLRHHPNKPEETGYFPVSWCRTHGKGRVFYTSLGHREDLWNNDPALPGRVNPAETSDQYRAHLLGGIRWALGLAEGSSDPNPAAQ